MAKKKKRKKMVDSLVRAVAKRKLCLPRNVVAVVVVVKEDVFVCGKLAVSPVAAAAAANCQFRLINGQSWLDSSSSSRKLAATLFSLCRPTSL